MKDLDRTQDRLISRRALLQAASVVTGVGVVSLSGCARVLEQPRFPGNPFQLGVASGDPWPDSVVLWTRLSTDPLGATGAGLPGAAVLVGWEVAHDEAFARVVRRGTVPATPERGYAVHAEVFGLESGREYFYRFQVGGEISSTGRTRTLPALNADVDRLRFAFVSCSDYQNGYFNAYGHLAQEDLDLVLHLGDYIYEYGPNPRGVRQHNGPEILTLEDCRRRYALYKGDTQLQAAHAAAPWIVVWDDHEVENNYAADVAEARESGEEPITREAFLARRAAAYQAYYENMPLRATSLPRGPDLQLYRRLTFGRLAQFSMLDTRQYRSDQPCGDGFKVPCAAVSDPNATLTGPAQERWLLDGLGASQSRWNILGQQVMFAQYDWRAGDPLVLNLDGWDGYPAARNRILGYIQARRPSNPVVLTGDIHSAWVHDLKADFSQPGSETLATELVTTSISADFPAAAIPGTAAALADNPHTRYFNGAARGYAVCDLTRETWRTDFRTVSGITSPTSTVTTDASFVIENGRPGARRV